MIKLIKGFIKSVLSVVTDLKEKKHTDAFILKTVVNMLETVLEII